MAPGVFFRGILICHNFVSPRAYFCHLLIAIVLAQSSGFPGTLPLIMVFSVNREGLVMLIKYLNDLDRAVQRARQTLDIDSIGRCMDCVAVLQDYLSGQMEPVQRKGFEIMAHLLPADFDVWTAKWLSARRSSVPMSRAAGAL